jgi:hypothetical protein
MTVIYLISEFMSWQTINNAEVRAGVLLREMYRKLHARTKRRKTTRTQ